MILMMMIIIIYLFYFIYFYFVTIFVIRFPMKRRWNSCQSPPGTPPAKETFDFAGPFVMVVYWGESGVLW